MESHGEKLKAATAPSSLEEEAPRPNTRRPWQLTIRQLTSINDHRNEMRQARKGSVFTRKVVVPVLVEGCLWRAYGNRKESKTRHN
jgi:hypothetical protein